MAEAKPAADKPAAAGKPAAPKPTAEQVPAETETALLTIGSKAPPIDIEHWISNGNGKFKPVTKFTPGKVYVVEFWATWCAPCVASMPHLAATQAKYADKGVQIISISDEDLETIQGFLTSNVRSSKPADTEETGEKEGAKAAEKNAKAAKEQNVEKQTYAQLTSAYCLTTDPDASVSIDYMEAAAQNGIPTSFIVGKTGLVEWIGHPMSLDEPLGQIVADKWDRAAFLVKFKKEQDHDSLMAKLGARMRKGDTKGALAIIADAKKTAAGDAASIAMLDKLEFQVRVTPIFAKIEEGEVKEGIAELDEVIKTATSEQKSELCMIKFKLLVESEEYDAAAKALMVVASDKNIDADSINQLTWQIYEAAREDDQFPMVLVEAATAATEKALVASPKSGMILDTLAHLVHYQGKLDRAIELQTQALANSDDSSDEGKQEMLAYLKELKKEKAGK
ncbi:MAG: TlpA family protein disulfide reductase [Fuerstia sp.]|nr:TlpA family protein disulfide reductase [Fuerstiella sp.]